MCDCHRLQFCPAEVQRKWFTRQFDLARDSGLPVFLHMRAAAEDMLKILHQKRACFRGGVVHSFDGTLQEAHAVLSLQGLCVGACSADAQPRTALARTSMQLCG